MANVSEKLGPLTRLDQSKGRRVVTDETARIIAEQLEAVARIEKEERRQGLVWGRPYGGQ